MAVPRRKLHRRPTIEDGIWAEGDWIPAEIGGKDRFKCKPIIFITSYATNSWRAKYKYHNINYMWSDDCIEFSEEQLRYQNI
jgi:hypothetical protein